MADDSTIFLAAFEASEPIGFVLAYELQRRHGDAAMLLVYEVDVHEAYRHRGVATSLLAELARIARERGIAEGFVLTDPDNDAANALYARPAASVVTSSSGTSAGDGSSHPRNGAWHRWHRETVPGTIRD